MVAFEPFPTNVAALSRHVAMNRLSNVEVVEAAVAESSGRGASSLVETSRRDGWRLPAQRRSPWIR